MPEYLVLQAPGSSVLLSCRVSAPLKPASFFCSREDQGFSFILPTENWALQGATLHADVVTL